ATASAMVLILSLSKDEDQARVRRFRSWGSSIETKLKEAGPVRRSGFFFATHALDDNLSLGRDARRGGVT
ncbi:hypothetical protein, partial [Caulobacter sp.]|uniref:hypothetical protein n=1 Tax=Caulobacter sp. TaxID=78 RepID=UPI003BAFD719